MKIYFVREKGSSDDSIVSQKAFKIFVNNKLHPVHIGENEASKVAITDEVVFVLEDLHSAIAIDLNANGASIISPYVVLYLKHESKVFHTIPKRSHSLMSQCLRSVVITSTGFSDEDEKESIIKKIKLMSGIYQPQLDSNVTVLIAKNILSEKYRVASSLGIPVVAKEWLMQCWCKYQYEIKSGFDMISKHIVPILYNLQFCVSGIALEDRTKVEKLVNTHGGKYSGVMNRFTDVLLSNGVQSPKTKLAESIDVAVVTIDWLYDSIKEKYAKSFDAYKINTFQKDDRYEMMFTEEINKKTGITKASQADNSKVILYAPITKFDATHQAFAIENIQHLCNKIKENGDLFLEDLTIFVIGFGPHLSRTIKRACTLAGAVFINSELDSSATQIIIGPNIADTVIDEHVVENLKKMKDKAVSIDWLIDSLRECIFCEPKLYQHDPFEPSTKRSARFITESSNKEKENHKIRKNKATVSRDAITLEPVVSKNIISPLGENGALQKQIKYIIFSGFKNSEELVDDHILSSMKVLPSIPVDKEIAKQTCMVLNDLNTSEKVLSSIASGLFIVKSDFLKSKTFNFEAAIQCEWAEELDIHKNNINEMFSLTNQKLLFSSRLTRKNLHQNEKRIFEELSVIFLNTSPELESIFVILKAGGATVYSATLDNLKHCTKNNVTLGLIDLKDYKKSHNREEKSAINSCALKYSKQKRLFQPAFISYFLCGLEPTSFDFFERFNENSSLLTEFYQSFYVSYEDFNEIK